MLTHSCYRNNLSLTRDVFLSAHRPAPACLAPSNQPLPGVLPHQAQQGSRARQDGGNQFSERELVSLEMSQEPARWGDAARRPLRKPPFGSG